MKYLYKLNRTATKKTVHIQSLTAINSNKKIYLLIYILITTTYIINHVTGFLINPTFLTLKSNNKTVKEIPWNVGLFMVAIRGQ